MRKNSHGFCLLLAPHHVTKSCVAAVVRRNLQSSVCHTREDQRLPCKGEALGPGDRSGSALLPRLSSMLGWGGLRMCVLAAVLRSGRAWRPPSFVATASLLFCAARDPQRCAPPLVESLWLRPGCSGALLHCREATCESDSSTGRLAEERRQLFAMETLSDGSRQETLMAPALRSSGRSLVGKLSSEEMLQSMKSFLAFLEEENGVKDYHLRVLPVTHPRFPGKARRPLPGGEVERLMEQAGWMVLAVTDSARTKRPADLPEAENPAFAMDLPIKYTDGAGKEVRSRIEVDWCLGSRPTCHDFPDVSKRQVTSSLTPKDLLVYESENFRTFLDAQVHRPCAFARLRS
eukprot:scaffold48_cov311-Pinguiococcus_pyrenoidosus.AAC.214